MIAVTQRGRETATVPRLLTKRTYLVPVLIAVARLPGAAGIRRRRTASGAAIGSPHARPRTVALAPPLGRFHRAIRVGQPADPRPSTAPSCAAQRREAFATCPAASLEATLDAIAACESGGDPTAVSSDGTYRGKYQFDYGTWESVGGSGDPAAAPEAEQDYRAALLYSQSGSSPWPVCG